MVKPKKEESTGKQLSQSIQDLGPVIDRDGDQAQRIARYWVPMKKVWSWSERAQKLTKRIGKYNDDSWLFMELIMDEEAHEMILKHKCVQQYQSESYTTVRAFP